VADVIVEFGSCQPIGGLREAAYRLVGEASCLIDTIDGRHVCRLTPKKALGGEADREAIRTRFLDLVTDENLREKIAAETIGVRDVIIALAFGALAREHDGSGSG
jgi:His-Xaa-Ser system protein HxsD